MNFFEKIKFFFIILLILINIIQYYIFPQFIHKYIWHLMIKLCKKIINVKVKIHGNTKLFNNNNLIIMSNHYDGLHDCDILFDLYYNENKKNILYTIVKSNIVGDMNDKSTLSIMMSSLKNFLLKSINLISYTRGDKKDGTIVKNIINEYLKNDKNVLVFPEGTTRTNGIPKDFKYGIFQVAVDNNLNILPITIKYNKDIGTEKGEPLNFSLLFNNVADVYIHDIIDYKKDECYKNKDFLALKNKTFDIICSPLISSTKNNNIIKEEEGALPKKTAEKDLPKKTADLPKKTADLPKKTADLPKPI